MMSQVMESQRAEYRQQFEELRLTRSLLLERHTGVYARPGGEFRSMHKFRCVTHWEDLLCVAINTKLERLMAVVSIRQPDGYSSVLNDHHSTEYIRFFIDWGRGESYQPVALHAFEVSDYNNICQKSRLPQHRLITAEFDADRYWDSVLDGIAPQVCAVLSWNHAPPQESAFQPVFGNRIESRIRTESIKDVMSLYQSESM
jgi:hypothetical protein